MSSPAQAPTSDGTGSPVNAPPTSPSAPPVTSLPPLQSPPVGSPLVPAPPVQAPVLGSPPVQLPPVQAPALATPVASPPPTVVSSPPPAPVLAPPTPVIQLSPPNFASPPPPVSTTPPPSDQSAPPPSEDVPPPETTPSAPPPARRSTPPADNSSPAPAGAPPLVASGRAPPGSPPAPPSFSPPVSSSGSSPQLDPRSLLPPPTSSTASSSSISSTAVIGLAAGGVAIFALVAVCLYCLLRRKSRRDVQDYRSSPQFYVNQKPGAFYDVERRGQYDSGFHSTASSGTGQPLYHSTPSTANSVHGSSNSNFSYEELAQATSGFSRANLLGEGGFGCVYKGVLPGGQEVAVKQLKIGGGQGEREFRAEVDIITRIHHRHLVTLVGYCIDANHRLLVYEFVPNDTLDYHLHGKGKQGKAAFDWSMRMKTAIGSSRGLAYLHEDCHPKIIHRDIKSSNILLDNNFEAQVADFGLAKLASDTHTHVSTRVMGTFGYLAPEYASSGKLTDKSDVYSFGVVLLELITGRKPVDTSQPLGEESLVEWSRPLITQALETGNFDDLVDPLLAEYNAEEMLVMIRTAAACVRHSASKRPKMSQIVRILETDADSKGGFNDFSTKHDTALHSADLRMFRKMALGTSQEYGSEYSGATSEYGVNPSVSSREFDSKERPRTTTDESEWPLRH